MDWKQHLKQLGTFLIESIDVNFVAICIVLGTIMWVLWCLDREERTPFRIVNFFKTNGHEDIAKLVLLFMSVVIAWSMIIQVKRESLDIYELMAYMAYALGAPMFYAFLNTVTGIAGKPEIVNKMAEMKQRSTDTPPTPPKQEGQ